MATIKGKWMFNEDIVVTGVPFGDVEVFFTSNTTTYQKMNFLTLFGLLKISYDDTVALEASSWVNESYRTVDFGTTEQTVSDEFYTWLTANAKEEITDLTNTTWYVPSGWSCDAGLTKSVDINGSINGSSFIGLCFGYHPYTGENTANYIFATDSNSALTDFTTSDSLAITIEGGTGVINTTVIEWLTTYGTQLKVTDLTNTTWKYTVTTIVSPTGIATQTDGYSVNGAINGVSFATLASGVIWGSYTDGIDFNGVLLFPDDVSCTGSIGDEYIISFTGGTDTTNPKLIAWLSKWGELQVEEEGEAPPDDLAGYTVTVPANWVASSGYGQFSIDYEYTSGGSAVIGSSFSIGYRLDYDTFDVFPSANYIFILDEMFEVYPGSSFTMNITGGFDSSTSSLIQWFVDNNATFEKTDGEEEPEEPATPTKKFTRLYLGDVAYSSGGKCFGRLNKIPNSGWVIRAGSSVYPFFTLSEVASILGSLEYDEVSTLASFTCDGAYYLGIKQYNFDEIAIAVKKRARAGTGSAVESKHYIQFKENGSTSMAFNYYINSNSSAYVSETVTPSRTVYITNIDASNASNTYYSNLLAWLETNAVKQ